VTNGRTNLGSAECLNNHSPIWQSHTWLTFLYGGPSSPPPHTQNKVTATAIIHSKNISKDIVTYVPEPERMVELQVFPGLKNIPPP